MRGLVAAAAVVVVAVVGVACDNGETEQSGEAVAGAGGEANGAMPGNEAGQALDGGAAHQLGGNGPAATAGQASHAGGDLGAGGADVGSAGLGAAGSAQAGQAGAAEEPFVDDPSAEPGFDTDKTRFIDYGTLRVAFTRAVNVSTLSVTLSPAAPSQLAVTGVTEINAGTVHVSLSSYHLPRLYELQVEGELVDGTAFDLTTSLAGNGSRVGFLSKQTGPGDFKLWPNAPASAATGRDAADGICQAEAEAAGFQGQFVAYLSAVDKYDAGCRALGLDGALADDCGQSSPPDDDAPWLTPSGLPLVNGASSIIADDWLRPVTFHADGSYGSENEYTWTGTMEGAVAAEGGAFIRADCGDWSIGVEGNDHFGVSRHMMSEFLIQYSVPTDYLNSNVSCEWPSQLLCLQVGREFFGPSQLHHVTGKVAFVTETPFFFEGSSPTVASIDKACQEEAAGAGLANASAFYGYVGTATTDGLCHVLGRNGKVSNKCGLAALPSTPQWRRTDGLPLGTPQQLAANQLSYPNALSVTGALMLALSPLTTLEPGAQATFGSTRATGARWASWWSPNSFGVAYCFER